MKEPDRQELNLLQFQKFHLEPTFHLHSATGAMTRHTRCTHAFAQAALLESLGWVFLGCAVGYFPLKFISSYSIALQPYHDLMDLLEHGEYLFDHLWAKYFREALHRGSETPSIIGEREVTLEAFESYFVRFRSFAQSRSAIAATATLNFADPKNIQALLEVVINPDDLPDIDLGTADIGESSAYVLYAGFAESVDFLRALNILHREPHADATTHTTTTTFITRLIRWRFRRLEAADEQIDRLLDRYLDVLQLKDKQTRTACIEHFRTILSNWRGMLGYRRIAAGR